jgi:RNA polymerase sigma-70 factor, ECF subfamily
MVEGATSGEVTRMLEQLRGGDPGAADRLLPLIYHELRQAAGRALRREQPGHTLQATELAHEAYLRLAGAAAGPWESRSHFLAVAARAMRQVLVDHARRRNAAKRGGGWERITLGSAAAASEVSPDELLALDDALERLGALEPRLRSVVEVRYFGGLTERETAEALGVTERTVQRDWARARAWLHKELAAGQERG